MSEQQQRTAWQVVGVVAVALALATVYIFAESQKGRSGAGSTYRIAYTTHLGDRFGIVHCNIDGLDCSQLAEGDSTDLMPSAALASADAGVEPRVAFLRLDPHGDESEDAGPGMHGGVYVMGISGGQPTRVSTGLDRIVGVAPSWSPDGKHLAFGGVEDLNGDGAYALDESGIYVSDIDAGELRRVASGLLGGWRLSWAPAGDLLLATGMEPGNPVPFAFALDTSTGITYTHPSISQITSACWSPEGDRIAAYSKQDHQIHVFDTEGDGLFAFDAPNGDILELIWTPDAGGTAREGRFFAVTGLSFEQGAGPLYARSASADASEHWTPVVGAQSFIALLSASADGRYVAFTRFTSEQQGNLYVLERGEQEPRQLTSDSGFEGAATWVPLP